VYNRFDRRSARGIFQLIFETVAGSLKPREQVALDSTHIKAHRCARRRKRGASEQAIGVTKGGRNSKLHALVDKLCRPWVIILMPRQRCRLQGGAVGPECVSLIAGIKKLLGDKAYDNNLFASHSGRTGSRR
jgi:hypothetical protein